VTTSRSRSTVSTAQYLQEGGYVEAVLSSGQRFAFDGSLNPLVVPAGR
jgi:hypothetical protein